MKRGSKRTLGEILMISSLPVGFACLYGFMWSLEIRSEGGIDRFVSQRTDDGFFIGPPIFGLIRFFHENTIIMVLAMAVSVFLFSFGEKLYKKYEASLP